MGHLHKKKTDKNNPSYYSISQVMNLIREAVTRRYYVQLTALKIMCALKANTVIINVVNYLSFKNKINDNIIKQKKIYI